MYKVTGKIIIPVEEGVYVLHPSGSTYLREFRRISYSQLTEQFSVEDGMLQTPAGPYNLGNAYFVQNGSLSPRRTEPLLKHLKQEEQENVMETRKRSKERSMFRSGFTVGYAGPPRESITGTRNIDVGQTIVGDEAYTAGYRVPPVRPPY